MVSFFARRTAPLLVGIACLAMPAIASAQAAGAPLGTCSKSSWLSNIGKMEGDSKAGSISGDVQLLCDGTWIFADLITWDEHTVYASGHLLVTQEGLRVNADRMEMDRETRLGTFYHASGTARLTVDEPQHNMFGSMEPEMMFVAEKIEKIGPRSYRLTDGMFSTCMQPKPRWQLTGKNATVVLEDHASMRNAALRVKGVPVLFLPYMYYPLEKDDRATGFLIPTYSASGVRGQGFGDAFFWAIDRSQDATFYYDWFSKAGQQASAEYRYVLTKDKAYGNVFYRLLDESERLASDGTVERAAHRSFELTGAVRQALPRGFVLTGNTNYVSDITAQQLYQQNIYEQSRRDRNLAVAVAGPLIPSGRLWMTASTVQRDYFNGATVARKGTLPQLDLAFGGRGLRRSGPFQKVYFSASGQAVYNDVRPDLSQPVFDRSLWRFNGIANLRAPLSSLSYLTISGNASWQVTNWQKSIDLDTGAPVPIPITRNLFNLGADLNGPVLERVFKTPDNAYASSFTHDMQPFVSISWLSPFNERDRVIQIDPQIDQLVGGTTTINYGLTNLVFASTHGPNHTTRRREFLRVVLSQSWYSNAQAGAIDPNYPTATINTFSPVQLAVSTAANENFGANFRLYIDPVVRAVRSYSLTGYMIRGQHLTIEGGWQKRQYLPTVPGYNDPNNASHFLNTDTKLQFFNGKLGGRYGLNYDLKSQTFLQQRIQGYYASQCCGISVDYQMMNVSQFALQGVPRDRRLAITFTLAGIGSIATPLGGFAR